MLSPIERICSRCGETFVKNPSGVPVHLAWDGRIDVDRDADHTAGVDEWEEVTP
jgi:hypothetical protein